jgi:hypothetical protein
MPETYESVLLQPATADNERLRRALEYMLPFITVASVRSEIEEALAK